MIRLSKAFAALIQISYAASASGLPDNRHLVVNDHTFSVADAVASERYVAVNNGFTLIGDESDASLLETAAYSPDGQHAVFLVSRGLLAGNTTVFTLHLASLLANGMEHRELITLSSKANAPPIYAVRWVSDDVIAFIGEGELGNPQVHSIALDGELRTHTESSLSRPPLDVGAGFDLSVDGTTVFAVPETQTATSAYDDDTGYFLDNQTLAELVGINFETLRPAQYFFSAGGVTRRLEGVSNATSYFPPLISVSPGGRFAVVATSPPTVPEDWTAFPLMDKQARAGDPIGPLLAKLTLVDLDNGQRHELTGAPMVNTVTGARIVWDVGGDRVFLIDQFVSAENVAAMSRFGDPRSPAIVEFSLVSMSVTGLVDTLLPPEDGKFDIAFRASFHAADGVLEVVRGDDVMIYRETEGGWQRDRRSKSAPVQPFTLSIQQSVSTPAQMVTRIAGQDDAIPVDEINEHVRAKFNSARLFEWTDDAGRAWKGGLILPKAATAAQRLPLVIQTHSFSEGEFVITGTRGSSAGFSGQALASAGFAVLNMGHQRPDIVQSDGEFDVQAGGYGSAITALAADGIIDPERVGVAGWSRSGLWIQPALASEDDLFTAAIASDAASFGKWSYLYYHNWWSSWHQIFLKHSGTVPFGAGLDRWQERDPVTRVGAFRTPLLITRYGEGRRFPSWWEPYVAMKDAGEPVEYFMLPNAPHNPVQPQHQYRLQTLSLDWFRFWLQGYEDPDPEKAEQYNRWRALCTQHVSKLAVSDDPADQARAENQPCAMASAE